MINLISKLEWVWSWRGEKVGGPAGGRCCSSHVLIHTSACSRSPAWLKTTTSIRLLPTLEWWGQKMEKTVVGDEMAGGGPVSPCAPPWARCWGLTLHGSALPQETSNLVSRFVYEFNPRTSFHANCLRHMTLLQHKSASHWFLFLKKFAFWILFKYSTAKGQDGWKIGCPFFSSQTFSSWLGTFVKLLCFTFFPESGCVWVKNDFHRHYSLDTLSQNDFQRHYSLDTFGSKWLSQALQPGCVESKMTFPGITAWIHWVKMTFTGLR